MDSNRNMQQSNVLNTFPPFQAPPNMRPNAINPNYPPNLHPTMFNNPHPFHSMHPPHPNMPPMHHTRIVPFPVASGTQTKVSSNNPEDLKKIEDYIVSLLRKPQEEKPSTTEHVVQKNSNPRVQNTKKEEKSKVQIQYQPKQKDKVASLPQVSQVDEKKEESQVEAKEETRGKKKKKNRKKKALELPKNFDKLTQDTQQLVESIKQSEAEANRRIELLQRVQEMIDQQWPKVGAKLHLFGSSVSQFAVKNSDVDMTLMIDPNVGSPSNIIQKLGAMLRKRRMKNVKALPKARVPIVKFVDRLTNLSCDICLSNALALHNTKLISDYASIDPRVRYLGLAIKHWTKRRMINEPYEGTLSSYAYTLLLIHYLQHKKILPVLQQMISPSTPKVVVNGHNCTYYSDIEKIKGWGQDNHESLGELLAGFFHYFAHFDWHNNVVSVRLGRSIPVKEKGNTWETRDHRDEYAAWIEDPFETTHNLGRVTDFENLKVIKFEFRRAFKLISQLKPLAEVNRQWQEGE